MGVRLNLAQETLKNGLLVDVLHGHKQARRLQDIIFMGVPYSAISWYALWACQRFDYTDGVQLPTSPPYTCRLWSGLNQNLYNIKCKLFIMKHDKLCWCLITSGIWVFSCIMLFISFYEQKNIWGMVGFFSLGFSLPLLVSRFYDWSISRKKENGTTV